jgi:hypothetical protein
MPDVVLTGVPRVAIEFLPFPDESAQTFVDVL